jgi:hypothetical protein
LGYDLDETLPWHSTISRTRQLYGEEVFLSLFQKILSLCVQKGMVRGKRQAIDSAFVKANASMDSLVEKEVVEDAALYADELNENSEYQVTAKRKNLVEQHHEWKKKAYKDMPSGGLNKPETDENGNLVRPKFLSNHTHYSPTDPDSKIAVKPGKARQLVYSGQIAVDDAHHIITGAMACDAGKRDSQNLAAILGQTIENLRENNLKIKQIAADTGYSSGEALAFCEKNNIDAYIPNFGQYKAEREHFLFNEEKNQYECQRGNKAILTFKKQGKDSKGYDILTYRSSEKDCKTCPFVRECCGARTKFKKLTDSADKKYYDAMHAKKQANPQYFSRISKIRSRTVEPVLGTLTNFLNMKRVNTRGIKQANKHVLMSALCYNLKKVLKFEHHAFIGKVKSLFRNTEHIFLQNLPFTAFIVCFSALRIFIPQKIKSPFFPL